ncbi:hypothetical protein BH11PSE12_BH11PSE12_04930 [soil metagenome]
MSSVNESSGSIIDITSVINGIAFQTNLPVFNAAVVAARADEKNRRFVVVVVEKVKNVAQRSAGANKYPACSTRVICPGKNRENRRIDGYPGTL